MDIQYSVDSSQQSAKNRYSVFSSQQSAKNKKLTPDYLLPSTVCRLPFTDYRLPTTDKKGFNLMEVMVVVVIMGILIIASMPLFRSFTRGRNLKEGANMVTSALRKSREAAITYRKNYRTVLDTLNQAVAIYEDDNQVNPAENWQRLPELVNFNKVSTDWHTGNAGDYDSNYGTDIYWIEFKPAGSLGGVGFNEQKVVLKEESTGDTKLIKVTALTGRIRIE